MLYQAPTWVIDSVDGDGRCGRWRSSSGWGGSYNTIKHICWHYGALSAHLSSLLHVAGLRLMLELVLEVVLG